MWVLLYVLVLTFCHWTLKIETEAGSDEESDELDSEINGEIEVSKVTEMRIIPSNPVQCILFVVDCLIKMFVYFGAIFISCSNTGFQSYCTFYAENYRDSFHDPFMHYLV